MKNETVIYSHSENNMQHGLGKAQPLSQEEIAKIEKLFSVK